MSTHRISAANTSSDMPAQKSPKLPARSPPSKRALKPVTYSTAVIEKKAIRYLAAKKKSAKRVSSDKKGVTAKQDTNKSAINALDKVRQVNSKEPLMRLPGELRNKIYILAIEDDLAEAKSKVKGPWLGGSSDVTTVFQQLLKAPEFISTCHQMRIECSGLFIPKTVEIYHRFFGQYAAQPMSALQLRSQLKGCYRTTAYEHETALEAKEKWQGLLGAAQQYNVAGVVTWDPSLEVKPMWFAGESGSFSMSFCF